MSIELEVMRDVFWGGRKMGFSAPKPTPSFSSQQQHHRSLSASLSFVLTAVRDVFSILAFIRGGENISFLLQPENLFLESPCSKNHLGITSLSVMISKTLSSLFDLKME